MGDFDFGQFKEIYDYIIDKLNDGDALTPQEQQVYDMLIGFANQGLNLTDSADFNSLYTAFNGLADDATKAEFERLYGKDLTQGPTGQYSFSQPGSVIENFQRRGLSINDGPTVAALTEGLKNYTRDLAQNKFASMTNSYAAMTPIRQQNINAATGAGNVASTAIGRRVPVAGVAGGAARRGGGPEGPGEGEPINVPVPPKPDTPSILERLAPDLIKLFGGGLLAGGGALFKDWLQERKKPQEYSQDELDRATKEIVDRNSFDQLNPQPAEGTADALNAMRDTSGINMAAFTGGQGALNPYGEWPEAQDMSGYGSYQNQAWQSPQQEPVDYGSYANPYADTQQQQNYNYYDPGVEDYDWGGWDSGGTDWGDWGGGGNDYSWYSGGDSYYDDGSGWY